MGDERSVTRSADMAASVAIGCLDDVAAGARPLVIDEATGALAAALVERGFAADLWLRRATAQTAGAVWPSGGPFTSAFLRLPKAKDALDFSLHAAASVVAPGGTLVLFGANDEGVRSVAGHLAAVADPVSTVAARRHCRVLAGARKAEIAGLRPNLGQWRNVREIALPGGMRPWVSYPGVFARGGLDPGTALLLAHLPKLRASARVLDFAAGTGVIAAALLQLAPGVAVDLVEIDALALAAAAENVPAARAFSGVGLAAVGDARYDLILSNPPVHEGVADDSAVLQALIADAPRYLVPGGALQIVVQRRIQAATLFEQTFGNVEQIAVNGGFQVLAGRRISRNGAYIRSRP